jgi:hypothetical protein
MEAIVEPLYLEFFDYFLQKNHHTNKQSLLIPLIYDAKIQNDIRVVQKYKQTFSS